MLCWARLHPSDARFWQLESDQQVPVHFRHPFQKVCAIGLCCSCLHSSSRCLQYSSRISATILGYFMQYMDA